MIRLIIVCIAGFGAGYPAFAAVDSNTFGGLHARAIGPAVMSGRIAAVELVPGNPMTIYAGAAGGGVWCSTDGGTSFESIFDDETQSIGALTAVGEETLWVGTGETWVRNSVSVGNGVYRSTDGGDTWEHKGLEASERIAEIIVDPRDSDRVFICATGPLWNSGGERGVYRSSDAGDSWDRVLFVDGDTGCSSMSYDLQQPDILYAGMWQFRRQPWIFDSGGPGSGLYRSTDGGDTWVELRDGLPEGDKGRIAVAVAPSRPSRVYAMVEAKKSALYRSDDLGSSWTKVSTSTAVTSRPFYFANLIVDPEDFDRIYAPGFMLSVSDDGGESFAMMATGGVHPDLHALSVNPDEPNELVLGTDGGLYISRDRGANWIMARSLPVSQLYEVSADRQWPYNVYCGLQDNGTWTGPSRAPGGISNRDWQMVGYGDGFHAYPDLSDPNIIYSEYQGGQLLRFERSTGEIKSIKAYEAEGEDELRFNWNTPVVLSEAVPGRMYIGAQYLLRSDDRGETWSRISPDLTSNDPEKQKQELSGGLTIDNTTAENHTTIFTISESRLDAKIIWVGTDDGNLQLSTDSGATWKNTVGEISDLPPATWVSSVQASQHELGRVWATFDGHRTGDMATYLYTSNDFGATWIRRTEGVEGYAHIVVEDPVNAQILYLGTEHGLWISIDGGEAWARFTGNLPPVSVRDLDIHPTEHDLIIGTHGRGIYILDDLTPLRAITADIMDSKVELLPSRPSVMALPGGMSWFSGGDEFTGPNPPSAATIYFYQKKRHIFGDMKIEVYNADGELMATLAAGKRRGINRVLWPTYLPPPKVPPANALSPAFLGPKVSEGTYTIKLIKGKEERETTITLVADPRSPHSKDDRSVQHDVSIKLYNKLESLTYVVDGVTGLREQAKQRSADLGGSGRLFDRLDELAGRAESLRTSLVATSDAGMLSGEKRLREHLSEVYGNVVRYEGRPSNDQLRRGEILGREVEQAAVDFDAILSSENFAWINERLAKKDMEAIVVLDREAWKAENQTGETPSGLFQFVGYW